MFISTLFDGLSKSVLRHFVDAFQCRLQVHQPYKMEIFQIHHTQIADKAINGRKEVLMDYLQD